MWRGLELGTQKMEIKIGQRWRYEDSSGYNFILEVTNPPNTGKIVQVFGNKITGVCIGNIGSRSDSYSYSYLEGQDAGVIK
jgi:hypothetical protein